MNIKFLLSLLLTLALVVSGSTAWAKVQGACSDCHTMHNSQDGSDVVAELGRSLTKGDCVGCHTGANAAGGNIPYITDTSEPTYTSADGTSGTTLAGGSFYWVANGGDAKGHNVLNIAAGKDANMPNLDPPGWNPAVSNNVIAGGDATWSNQLTCAGTYGCHGPHGAADDFQDIAGAHHGDDSVIDGSTAAKSYRFLNGIIGYEAADWELSPSATNRNEYHGVARKSITTGGGESDQKTISYFCATCHGNYHSGDGISSAAQEASIGENPWLRHPTDYDMADTAVGSEYRSYNQDGTYSVEAPVAFDLGASVTKASHALNSVAFTGGKAIVTCISCHRAHGSPHDDLLRWAYSPTNDTGAVMSAGSGAGNVGCFVCHTTKN
ncbi:MAG: cytochrome c3 family protein [Desulfuromonas sp.]|nr:cytochrome c3 family protein [Desulfuromonas sp.]